MRSFLTLTILVGCQVSDTGEVVQNGTVTSIQTTDRWYGVQSINRVNFYPVTSGTYQLPSSYVNAQRQTARMYNDLTALDFHEIAASEAANDPEPHVLYLQVNDPDWVSKAKSYSGIVNCSADIDNNDRLTCGNILDVFGPSGNGYLRPASGARREDHVVAYRPGLVLSTVANPNAAWSWLGNMTLHVHVHETGHAVGLAHEMNRTDRCGAIRLFPDCMDPDLESQFNMQSDVDEQGFIRVVLSPYDIKSVMHYGSGFGSLGCRSMLAPAQVTDHVRTTNEQSMHVPAQGADNTCGVREDGWTIPQWPDLSEEDVNVLQQMYPAKLAVDAANDRFGGASAAGDFDGDGYLDLAVGVPNKSSQAGSVLVYKGTFTGLEPWRKLAPPALVAGDQFGAVLQAIDVDGDGLSDLVVGAPGSDVGAAQNAGKLWVFHGQRGGITNARVVTMADLGLTPTSNDRFGSALTAGRFRGATRQQLAIGVPARHGVYIVDWAGAWPSATLTLRTTLGGSRVVADSFGHALAAGDLNGDGLDDLVIGSPELGWTNRAGHVYIAWGNSSSTVTATLRVVDEPETTVARDGFGRSVGFGHLAGANARNLVVGAPLRAGTGHVYVFDASFARIANLRPQDFGISGASSDFGGTLATGNFDGSGVQHLAVGAAGATFGAPGSGIVGIYRLVNGTITPGNFFSNWDGPRASGAYGASLAVGNFDGKGPQELAVGEPGASNAPGDVWIVHGTSHSLDYISDDDPAPNVTFLSQGPAGGASLMEYRR